MLGVKSVSRWQFALFRILFGGYLALHFAQLLPYAGELFSAEGTLGDPQLSPLFGLLPSPFWWHDSGGVAQFLIGTGILSSGAFMIGWRRKLAALLSLYIWACLYCRNPLIANPSLGYVGLMLLLSTLVPGSEAMCFGGGSRRAWYYPAGVYGAAWLLLAIGYTFSGLIKLQSPSWLDGSALLHLLENPLARPGPLRDLLQSLPEVWLRGLTWFSLVGEILFLPLSIWRRGRLVVWGWMMAMHLGILLVVDFADLTAAMVLMHLFVLDPDWWSVRADGCNRILFYDGECGLCTHSVKFFLEEDRGRRLCYAPLQGETAQEWLPPDLREPTALSTVVYLTVSNEGQAKWRTRSAAVARALLDVGGFWRLAGWALVLIPRPIREWAYRLVARHRLKFFSAGACALPTREEAARLLP